MVGAGDAVGVGSQCFMETEPQSGKMESSGDGWGWWWLHNSVSVPDATELCT